MGANGRKADWKMSVCSLNSAQQSGKIAILTGSGLDFINGDFRKITAFKSYGVKTKPICKLAQAYLDYTPPFGVRGDIGSGRVSSHAMTITLSTK